MRDFAPGRRSVFPSLIPVHITGGHQTPKVIHHFCYVSGQSKKWENRATLDGFLIDHNEVITKYHHWEYTRICLLIFTKRKGQRETEETIHSSALFHLTWERTRRQQKIVGPRLESLNNHIGPLSIWGEIWTLQSTANPFIPFFTPFRKGAIGRPLTGVRYQGEGKADWGQSEKTSRNPDRA